MDLDDVFRDEIRKNFHKNLLFFWILSQKLPDMAGEPVSKLLRAHKKGKYRRSISIMVLSWPEMIFPYEKITKLFQNNAFRKIKFLEILK